LLRVHPSNVAIRYRDGRKYRRAYFWWRRAAASGDGDAWADVGYCLEHGIGVRRDVDSALQAYAQAIQSSWVTPWVQEEAHYRRAVLLVVHGGGVRHQVLKHLRIASADGDYPEAVLLLSCVTKRTPLQVCNCRRGRGVHVRGQARCMLHRGRNRHRS